MEVCNRYDVLLLGTGLTECLLAAILAKEGKRVLFIDRERFCGGANGSITSLSCLYNQFGWKEPKFGGREEWSIDLMPKMFMLGDEMCEMLKFVGVDINRLTKSIHGEFYFQDGTLTKLPCKLLDIAYNKLFEGDAKAFQDLVVFAKKRAKSNKTKCSRGISGLDLASNIFDRFAIGQKTKTVLQHIFANDSCSDEQTCDGMLNRIARNFTIPNSQTSAHLYPLFGTGEVIQELLRLAQTLGARCMLNRAVIDVQQKRDGYVYVKAPGLYAKAPWLIGSPSYLPGSVNSCGGVIRCIALFNQPFPPALQSSKASLVTIPSNSGCSAIKMCLLGNHHNVAPKGKYVAYVSARATSNQLTTAEVENVLLSTCGESLAQFVWEDKLYEPKSNDKPGCRVFASCSYDHTFDCDQVCNDVARLYGKIEHSPLRL